MFALPFDAAVLRHTVHVVDPDPPADVCERLWRRFGSLDRARERDTLLSVGGAFRWRDAVKGFGVELAELPQGSWERRGALKRAVLLLQKLRELAPQHVDIATRQRSLALGLAARAAETARPRPAPAAPRAARRAARGIAVLLKSDLAEPSAHVGQTLRSAAALAERGRAVTVAAPLSHGSFGETLARVGCAGAGAPAETLEHWRIEPPRRAVSELAEIHSLIGRLAGAGARVLYFRQARLASQVVPAARRHGLVVVLEAHQPYTTWALVERRRLWSAFAAGAAWFGALARHDRAYEARCYREVDGVVATTRAMAARVRRLAPGARVLLLRNGAPAVEPGCVLPNDARPLELLYAGKTAETKGTAVLLRALAALPGTRLAIVGGPTEADLAPYRELAQRLGVAERVEFSSWEPQAVLFERLANARVAVHPLPGTGSREWRLYTCPLKLLEAMALGTTVVASDLPAIREILADERTGLLVAPGDARALAAAIARLLADPPLADRLADAAAKRASVWSHENRARRLDRFLASLAGDTP